MSGLPELWDDVTLCNRLGLNQARRFRAARMHAGLTGTRQRKGIRLLLRFNNIAGIHTLHSLSKLVLKQAMALLSMGVMPSGR